LRSGALTVKKGVTVSDNKNHKPVSDVVGGNNTDYDGRLYHLDDGGIYFESNDKLAPGDKINITIKRLNNSEVTLDVEVLWRKESETSNFAYGYAVRAVSPEAVLKKV
jgi:Tfp pilus assembly protein PilZ